ncbi:MAG: ferredoxin thioredoxin reductase catalytic beta chain [Ruminococcus sp.]|nr:ferredoxin thioredoxin reductase catalytic beta chain [Ruminococcus sp.]
MKIILNKDKTIVKNVRESIARTGGYCPCMSVKSRSTVCICEDFLNKIADPDFEGYCHCLMYYKQK